ncbi:MAG TPA: nuclear transport factor 2 family protein [Xanthobacteraceae bacterium]|nr:nuclear transport factor 2 family protein [Xanthobacteraceae bacterium]
MRPEDLHPALSEAYNAGDLEGVLALYDPKAVFVIKPGRVTETPAELRAALKHVVDLRGRMTIKPQSFIRSDDVVLVLGTFTLAGRRGDGTAFERTSRFADVLRRQPDGRWLVAVDSPFGGD